MWVDGLGGTTGGSGGGQAHRTRVRCASQSVDRGENLRLADAKPAAGQGLRRPGERQRGLRSAGHDPPHAEQNFPAEGLMKHALTHTSPGGIVSSHTSQLDRRPLSLHQSTRPCRIQKWQWQSFICRTDGETVGRFSQSGTAVHLGLLFLLRDSLMVSPQPPGQRKQAHLSTPSRTTVISPGTI